VGSAYHQPKVLQRAHRYDCLRPDQTRRSLSVANSSGISVTRTIQLCLAVRISLTVVRLRANGSVATANAKLAISSVYRNTYRTDAVVLGVVVGRAHLLVAAELAAGIGRVGHHDTSMSVAGTCPAGPVRRRPGRRARTLRVLGESRTAGPIRNRSRTRSWRRTRRGAILLSRAAVRDGCMMGTARPRKAL
jgi:hypothetical protein